MKDQIVHLQAQCLVLATLLGNAVDVVKTIEPENSDEEDQIQTLIEQSTAAIETVLREHAMPQAAGTPDIPVAHHPV